MWILLTILVGGAALLGYLAVDKKVNQTRCRNCGSWVSIDALTEECPRCGTIIEEDPAPDKSTEF